MDKRKKLRFKYTITWMLLLTLISGLSLSVHAYLSPVEGTFLLASVPKVTVDEISDKYPDDTITVSGETNFDEINLKIIYPNGGIYYIERVLSTNGSYVCTFKLSKELPYGIYSVIVGKGDIVAKTTFMVKERVVIPDPDPASPEQDPEADPDEETTPPIAPPATPPVVLPTTPEVTIKEDGSVKIEVAKLDLDEKSVASVSIDKSLLDTALEKVMADENGKKSLELSLSETEGAKTYQLEFPAETLFKSDSSFEYKIITKFAEVTIPSNMLASAGDKVLLSITAVDNATLSQESQIAIGNKPVIRLNLSLDGTNIEWNNPEAPVTVAIPYTPEKDEDPEKIAVWYIDGKENVIPVYNGRYDANAGRVIFSTSHFSQYAVVYVNKTFEDISGYPWAQRAIEVLASKGIVKGTSTTKSVYSPSLNITRADYIALLVRTLGLSAKVDENFSDVEEGDYFYEVVGIAKKLGIAKGIGDNKFAPRSEITRQEMMTLTARALNVLDILELDGNTSELNKFKDAPELAAYAVEGTAALVREGLILGSGNLLNPKDNTTRAEVAVLMYRIYNKIYNK